MVTDSGRIENGRWPDNISASRLRHQSLLVKPFRVKRSRSLGPPRPPRTSGMRMRNALLGRVERESVSHTGRTPSSRVCPPTHAAHQTHANEPFFYAPLPSRPAAANLLLFRKRPIIDRDISAMHVSSLWGWKGLFRRAGPSLTGVFVHRTQYNVVWLGDVANTTRPICVKSRCQTLIRKSVGLDCTMSVTFSRERRMPTR